MNESNSQAEANNKWQKKNRDHTRYLHNRSTAKSFLRKQATLEDIEEMERLISERKNSLLLDLE